PLRSLRHAADQLQRRPRPVPARIPRPRRGPAAAPGRSGRPALQRAGRQLPRAAPGGPVIGFPAAINPADNPLSPEFYNILIKNFGPAVAPGAVGLAVTVALVPVAIWLSYRVGAVSKPGGRNIHSRPTARLGGLALAGGFL